METHTTNSNPVVGMENMGGASSCGVVMLGNVLRCGVGCVFYECEIEIAEHLLIECL